MMWFWQNFALRWVFFLSDDYVQFIVMYTCDFETLFVEKLILIPVFGQQV